MGIQITESELPISKHSKIECYSCKQVRYARQVKVYSAFGGADRGYYPLCFHCFGPVFRWTKTHLKESHDYETPYSYSQYIDELESLEPTQPQPPTPAAEERE